MQTKRIYLTFSLGVVCLSLFGVFVIPRLDNNTVRVSPVVVIGKSNTTQKGYIPYGRNVDDAVLSNFLPPAPLDAMPYEVRTPLSNGVSVPIKKRWLWIPEDSRIVVEKAADGSITVKVPEGAKWWKEFYLETDKGAFLIERRIILKTAMGWNFYTAHYAPTSRDNKITVATDSDEAARYTFQVDEWMPTQPLDSALEIQMRDKRGKTYPYIFPGQDNCMGCHNGAAGAYPNTGSAAVFVFGFHPNNLTSESFQALVNRGWIVGGENLLTDGYPGSSPSASSVTADITLETKTQTLVAALRNNCVSCHNASEKAMARGTGFILDPNKNYSTSELLTILSNRGKMYGDATNPIVTPGDPEHSEIMLRLLGKDGRRRMPPAEGGLPERYTHMIDIVQDWIRSVK